MLFLTLYNGKNHYKTADEEEYPLPFLSLCNPIISARFHSYPSPHMYPFLLLTKQLSFVFFVLPNANTPLVYLLFVIKQQFYDHEFNSCTENLKPMGD